MTPSPGLSTLLRTEPMERLGALCEERGFAYRLDGETLVLEGPDRVRRFRAGSAERTVECAREWLFHRG